MHNVTPTSSSTGDGVSKADYVTRGIVFFDTYVSAAKHALRHSLLSPAAVQRIAAVAAAESAVVAERRRLPRGLLSQVDDSGDAVDRALQDDVRSVQSGV
jgi:hypothetical protein